jgi:hypothetical protein
MKNSGRGECWWDYILHRQVRRVKRPECRKAGREMRVRTPPPERSLRTDVSPFLVATTYYSPHGECQWNYMDFSVGGSSPPPASAG